MYRTLPRTAALSLCLLAGLAACKNESTPASTSDTASTTAAAAGDRVAAEITGAERDEVWRDVVLAALPSVERYARKAGRTIPVARLTPTT